MPARLGQLLITSNIITEDQLKEALGLQRKEGGRLGTNLVKLGHITEEKLVAFLSRQYNVPAINLTDYKIDLSLLKLIPIDMARKYLIMPVARVGATITIAMVDPSNVFAIDDVKFRTGYNVEVVVSSESSILNAISTHYMDQAVVSTKNGFSLEMLQSKDYVLSDLEEGGEEGTMSIDGNFGNVDILDEVLDRALDNIEIVEEKEDAEVIREVAPPIVKLVNGMLVNAIKSGASDVHVEPYESSVRVRQRIDGQMYTIMNLPAKIKAAVSSRFKIMAKLGFEKGALRDFMTAVDKPYGMLLVTGPTGSGKTTTLYSALNYLNKVGINISTAEDPVEYNFLGINQVQVKEDIGLTFAAALRSFLRQDPDVIMVGEIRDFETAEIAVKAALTGHLVLSTLHTNEAPSTVNRLLNMGVEPFLVASSVNLILAQRLVRKICTACKEPVEISDQALLD